MTANDVIKLLEGVAQGVGLARELATIVTKARAEHPELGPPPPEASRERIDSDVDAELAERERKERGT